MLNVEFFKETSLRKTCVRLVTVKDVNVLVYLGNVSAVSYYLDKSILKYFLML